MADDESMAIEHAAMANMRRDLPAALKRWQSVRERFPNNPWGIAGSIQALRAAGHTDQLNQLVPIAKALLQNSSARIGDPTALLHLELEVALSCADWSSVKRSAQVIIGTDKEHAGHVWLALGQACWHLRELDAADWAAQNALAADSTLTEALLLRVWVATDRGEGETALGFYRRLVELNPATVRWWLKFAHLLNAQGHIEEALSTLQTINTRWPTDPAVKMFMKSSGLSASLEVEAPDAHLELAIRNAPRAPRLLRPLIVPDPRRDLLIAPHRAETALLVFTSSNDGLGMPVGIFDRYLAALPVSCIYLKDFRRLRFLGGVRSLGNDYTGTIAALRGILSDLGAKRLCTIGNCGGGFAAIRYGVELGAERILAFEALTHVSDASSMKFEKGNNFSGVRLSQHGVGEMSDLRPFLEARKYSSQIRLLYGETDQHDLIHASHLAGLPGVTLCPQINVGHHLLLRHLASSTTDFSAELAAMLGVAVE